MRKYLNLISWAVILSNVLSACRSLPGPRAMTCADLLATPLQSYIGQVTTPETFVEVVENAYGISQQGIDVQTQEKNYWSVRWTHKGYRYAAWTDNDGHIERIVVELYEPGGVKVGQLLDCIGSQPEWYSAFYGMEAPRTGNTYHLNLYFPRQGIVATGSGYTQRNEPSPLLSADSPLNDVVIGVPGSLSDLYEQRWDTPLEAAHPAWQPVPWPGDWSALRWVEDR